MTSPMETYEELSSSALTLARIWFVSSSCYIVKYQICAEGKWNNNITETIKHWLTRHGVVMHREIQWAQKDTEIINGFALIGWYK